MTLLERVAGYLSQRAIPHALIGASALAVHGISRSTHDQDLLTRDRRVLSPQFWSTLYAEATVDVRPGDAEDPLAGVVRIRQAGERDVDVVVGLSSWQDSVLERAATIGGGPLRVVDAADLVLLKLYAGGSQDRWDIEQVLMLDVEGTIARTVDERVAVLPSRSRQIWSTLRPRE